MIVRAVMSIHEFVRLAVTTIMRTLDVEVCLQVLDLRTARKCPSRRQQLTTFNWHLAGLRLWHCWRSKCYSAM